MTQHSGHSLPARRGRKQKLKFLVALGLVAVALAAAIFWPAALRRAAMFDPARPALANDPPGTPTPTPENEYRSGPPMTWDHEE